MSYAVKIADFLADRLLKLVAIANLLFVATFLVVVLVAARDVEAATDASCNGRNMIEELRREDPAALADLRAQAAKIINSQGVLWRIEKEGLDPSFLLGTMHLTDSRVTELNAAARQAFNASNRIVIETTDILDQQQAALSLLKHPELTMLTGDKTLKSLMTEEERQTVDAALSKRGVSLASVNKMQPWLLTAMVSLPVCELARRGEGMPVLDVKLAEDAKAAGKPVVGLETAVSQLRAMASLPLHFHIQGLVETLRLGDKIDDVFETLIVLYKAGETGMFWPLFKTIQSDVDGASLAEFERKMITVRNHKMVQNAQPYLREGGAFIAVGAMHLPGKEGLVELLRDDGFVVKAIK